MPARTVPPEYQRFLLLQRKRVKAYLAYREEAYKRKKAQESDRRWEAGVCAWHTVDGSLQRVLERDR